MVGLVTASLAILALLQPAIKVSMVLHFVVS